MLWRNNIAVSIYRAIKCFEIQIRTFDLRSLHFADTFHRERVILFTFLCFMILAVFTSISQSYADGEKPGREMSAQVIRYSYYLENNPKIKKAITWEIEGRIVSMDQWDDRYINALWKAVESVENGEMKPFTEAPRPEERGFMSMWNEVTKALNNCQPMKVSLKIFLYHVAFSLKMELEGRFEWRLVDMDDGELALLFGYDNFVQKSNHCYYCFLEIFNCTPESVAEFLEREGIIRDNHRETVFELTRWMTSNLEHIVLIPEYGDDYFDYQTIQKRVYGRSGIPEMELLLDGVKLKEEDLIAHSTKGCGMTSRIKDLDGDARLEIAFKYQSGVPIDVIAKEYRA